MELQKIMKKTNEQRQLIEALKRKDEEIERLKIQLKLSDQSQSEKLYQSILNQIPDIIYRLDQDGRIIFISESIMNYGYEVSDLLGKDILEYVHPEDRVESKFHLKERRTGQRATKSFKVRFLSRTIVPGKNDELYNPYTFLLNAEGIYGRQSINSRHFMGTQGRAHIAEDIEPGKGKSAELYSILAMMADSVILTDLEGKIEYVNPAFETLTGFALDEVKGKTSNFLKSGEHDDSCYKNLWNTITRNEKWQGIIINKSKQGKLIYEDSAIFPLMNSNGEKIKYVAVKRDITSQKELEYQLLQSQKMEMLGQLASGIAHDFNNYMTVINGYADMLITDTDAKSPYQNKLKEIQKSAIQAQVLTKQLLSFSRLKDSVRNLISVNDSISELQNMLKKLIGEDIQLISELFEHDIIIEADTGQFEQIVINLVVNARDAIYRKKQFSTLNKIIVRTAIEIPKEKVRQNYPDLQNKEYLVLSVLDTGTGISDGMIDKIFDPFFTTKRPGKGTGLGLSTVYNIVKQNNGGIYVKTKTGRGSEFKIFLPFKEIGKEKKVYSPPEPVKLRPEFDKTICIIEDDDYVRKFTETALEGLGYRVFGFDSAKVALHEIFSDGRGQIPDLIITDERFPDPKSDMRLNVLTDKRILYVSGYKENELVKTGILAKGINYLQKPYSYKALTEKVRHIIDRNSNN